MYSRRTQAASVVVNSKIVFGVGQVCRGWEKTIVFDARTKENK
jgi:hypothetical protein